MGRRMPGHLRALARDYDLQKWVDNSCPLEPYCVTVHGFIERLQAHAEENEDELDEEVLANLVAQVLAWDGTLEDYVIEQELDSHDDSNPAVLASVHHAAAILVIRRYRKALKDGDWQPATPESAS